MPPPLLTRILPRLRTLLSLPLTLRRTLAVPAPSVYASPDPSRRGPWVDRDGRLRPQLNVRVREDHGLYKFFHFDPVSEKPITLEPLNTEAKQSETGRAWEAGELRRKSFRDLHILWYIVLRERNVLATQKLEFTREGLDQRNHTHIEYQEDKLRQTTKRIKWILNERRRAFKEARLITRRAERDRKNWEARMARRRAEAEAAGENGVEQATAEVV